jgi:pentatricopeptide repeat protein
VEIDPERLDSLFSMGVCFSKADRPDDAIRVFRQLLDQDQSNADAWYYLGLSYDKKGDSRSAREAYRMADTHGRRPRREGS